DQGGRAKGGVGPGWLGGVVPIEERAEASRRSRFLLADGREDRRVPGDDEGTFQVGGSRAVAGHVPTGRYLSLVVGAKAWRRRRAFDVDPVGFSPAPPPVAPSSLGPVTWLKR